MKIKKALTTITIALVAIVIIISLTTSCFIQGNIALNKAKEDEKIEFNKTKEEIIKFDDDYWKITDEFTDKQKTWADEVKDKGFLEWIKINEAEKKYYSEYILKFKNLTIPEPLQDFYYKKLEQCNVELEEYDNLTETLEFILSEQQNMKQEQSSLSMGNGVKLAEEGNNLSQKRFDLDLKCKQIIEDVYLEYNLDDLINKWQKIPQNIPETTTKAAIIEVEFEYNIGDTGPAGGNIFYINPNYEDDGWRYLEAAPASQITSEKWCDMNTDITGATATAIGTGKANTQTILKILGEGHYAARLCRTLVEGDKGDWFLPSKDELNEIYVNLYLKGFDSFEGGYYGGSYWSSSESLQYGANLAWAQDFTTGNQCTTAKGNFDLWVNAVRSF